MSTTARVTASLLSLVLLACILELSQLSRIRVLQRDIETLGAVDLELARRALEIRRLVSETDEYRRKNAVLGDPGYAAVLAELEDRMRQELEDLGGLALSPEVDELVQQLTEDWRQGLENGAVGAAFVRSLTAHLDRLEALTETTIRERTEAAATRASRARRASIFWALASLVGAAFLAVTIARSVGEPIRRLSGAMRRVTTGDLDVRVGGRGSPEIQSLNADFNVMVDRLSELDRMKQEFVSGVSHDLKAPLASMRETTGLLLEGSVGEINDVQRELLELTQECNRRLYAMIEDLLDIARLEAGGEVFESAPDDLCAIVHEAVEEARTLKGGKPLELVFEAAEEELPVVVDRSLMLQLLRNLLSNAVRHSPDDTRVAVETGVARDGDHARSQFERLPEGIPFPAAYVAIEDRGPGVEPEEEERIFERFYRSKSSGRRGQGSGLGLAIAREIALGHRGKIWVENGAEGGSRFVLALPLFEGQREVRSEASAEVSSVEASSVEASSAEVLP